MTRCSSCANYILFFAFATEPSPQPTVQVKQSAATQTRRSIPLVKVLNMILVILTQPKLTLTLMVDPPTTTKLVATKVSLQRGQTSLKRERISWVASLGKIRLPSLSIPIPPFDRRTRTSTMLVSFDQHDID